MNNFEERKFLDYIEKLLPYTDTNDYNFDSVFDFFCEEFKVDRKPYPIDKDNCLNVDTRKKQERFAKLLKKEVIRLKEKIKPQNTLLEKQLLTIKKIYRLNNDEYEILLYLALKEFNKVFRKYFDCLYENSFATFTRVYLNMRYNRKDSLFFIISGGDMDFSCFEKFIGSADKSAYFRCKALVSYARQRLGKAPPSPTLYKRY